MVESLTNRAFAGVKKFAALFFLSLLFAGFAYASSPLYSDTANSTLISPKFFIYKPDPNIKVEENRFKAGLLFDVENKKIVWQKEMGYIYPIASLTKMM